MKGEMCILHRIVLRRGTTNDFIMVSCDSRCPHYKHKRR